MNIKLIMNIKSSEKRVAVIENEQVVEFLIQQPEHEEIVGNIYFGKVADVLPGMQAAFVDIGIKKNGYLHLQQIQSFHQKKKENSNLRNQSISSYVHQGEKLLVQVEKESFGTKGPKLTGIIEIPGTHIVYLPYGQYVGVSRKMVKEREKWRALGEKWLNNLEGIVFRTSCEGQSEEIIFNELTLLRTKFSEIQLKAQSAIAATVLYKGSYLVERLLRELPLAKITDIVVDDFQVYTTLKKELAILDETLTLTYHSKNENIFSYFHLEQELEKALKRIVWLSNGAYIIIDQTEAMTVIDVNTGKYSGKTSMKETVLKTNELAAKEIARQLRLRDIGGIILIDFIDMKDQDDKTKIINTLKQAFQHDRMRTNIIGFTGLGLVEMSRKKVRPNLNMQLTKPCPTCSGMGHIKSDEAVAYKLEREIWEHRSTEVEAIWVETTSSIICCLAGVNHEHLDRLQQLLQIKIYFTENDALDGTYVIRHLGTETDVKARMTKL